MDDLNKAFNHLFGFKVPIDDYDEFEKKVEEARELKEYLDREALETFIEVDGGIKVDNAGILKNAGADIIVSGSAIISAGDMQDVIEKMKKGV